MDLSNDRNVRRRSTAPEFSAPLTPPPQIDSFDTFPQQKKPESWIHDILEIINEEDHEVDKRDDEGISKILKSTIKLEKLLWFGVLLCFEQILTYLTILPLRICFRIISMPNSRRFVYDLACFSILIICIYFLVSFLGAAQVYHSIRLQTFMKLYVVVNIAEVLDRLLSSLGLDLFEILAETNPFTQTFGFFIRYLLCLVYTFVHAILFYVRLLTLSVAIHSSNDALFTILVSNNFVELKGNVFKKSTEQNLFQISCSDVVERFVLIVFMCLVALNEHDENIDVSNVKLQFFFFELTLGILFAEILVDWIKHMFIVRFNPEIKVKDVYERFLFILCEDFLGKSALVVDENRTKSIFPAVPQRLGLPILPICCVIVRVVAFDVSDVFYKKSWKFVFGYWCLALILKLFLRRVIEFWAVSITSFNEDDATSNVKTPPVTPPIPTYFLATPPSTKDKALEPPVFVTPALSSPQLSKVSSTGKQSTVKKTPQKSLTKVNRFENG